MKMLSDRPVPSEEEAIEKLNILGQEHLISHLKSLNKVEKEAILCEIESITPPFFFHLQKLIFEPADHTYEVEPFKAFFPAGNASDETKGKELMSQGKCACVVLAGGQGSRMRCSGPKGCTPVSVVKKKSLFHQKKKKVKIAFY